MKRVLISVFYKDKILDFAKFLISKNIEAIKERGIIPIDMVIVNLYPFLKNIKTTL